MKKIALVAALASLAACTPAAETEAPVEAAATEAAAVLAVDGGPSHGMYRITGSDGKVYMEEVREDGTFTNTDPDGVVTTGTWRQPSTNVYCVTAAAEGAAEVCHEETMDADGKWTTKDPTDGTVSVVERMPA
jgi:hypothetical protein